MIKRNNEENLVAKYNPKSNSLLYNFMYYILELDKISYIKRVIATEGDHIKTSGGKVYLNGEQLDEEYLSDGITTETFNFTDLIVPEGTVFVMGDNRPNSTDSRVFGCIPISKIEGKVWIRFWPLNKFGIINK